MLAKPPHIAQAIAPGVAPSFRWDEWSVTDAYDPADPALVARLALISHRGNIALCAATCEWIVWRFEGLDADQTPHHYIEAAWASIVHLAYARYVEFDDDQWRGVVRGPMNMALSILIELMWGRHDTEPGEHAAWQSNLAELVLPDPAPFVAWRDAMIDRLTVISPVPPDDADDVLAAGPPGGPWVPRQASDVSSRFDETRVREMMTNFIATVPWKTNPFLHSPDEMDEIPDYEGTPYVLTTAETEADG